MPCSQRRRPMRPVEASTDRILYCGPNLPNLSFSSGLFIDELFWKIDNSIGSGSGSLNSVSTSNSPTVTWAGNGTPGSPLVATVVLPPDAVTLTSAQTLSNKTLASPVLTGIPTAPTAATVTDTTQVATTAFVHAVAAAEVADYVPLTQKGAANGVAPLGADTKVPSQYLNISGGLTYKGSWNAATNTPALANGAGTNGDMYKVSVAGSRDLGGGVISFAEGDHVVYVGAPLNAWENFGASEAVSSVNGHTGVVTLVKADVGLGNVDNTSDVNKPISTATQTALNAKANAADLTAHISNVTNPHAVTKAQIGLSNVTNDTQVRQVDKATQALAQAGTDDITWMTPLKVKQAIGAGGANPTGQAGLTAVNGSALTFMRSDAAPAINQAIAPVWTGAHRFTAVATDTIASVAIASTTPQLDITVTNAPADTKRWNFVASPSAFSVRTLNDTGTTGSNIWSLARTGNAVTTQQWFISNVLKMDMTATYVQSYVPMISNTGADGAKLWLAKHTSGTHQDAPTTLGAASTYLYIGGREYQNNGFAGIGFGYVADTTNHPAVWVGYEEKTTTGNTNGDYIVAVRATTTNVAPAPVLRITSAGQILAEVGAAYVPGTDGSLVTKKNLDDALAGVGGAFNYLGSWNASTNTPHIENATGTTGDMYKVATAGTQNLGAGNINFNVGDHVVYIGGTANEWEVFASSEAVSSVNAKTGVVVLAKADIGLANVTNDAQVKVADLASQVEATTGTDNTKWMTPLRVAEAIAAHPAAAGGVGGTNKQLQYNNNGVFGGTSAQYTDGTEFGPSGLIITGGSSYPGVMLTSSGTDGWGVEQVFEDFVIERLNGNNPTNNFAVQIQGTGDDITAINVATTAGAASININSPTVNINGHDANDASALFTKGVIPQARLAFGNPTVDAFLRGDGAWAIPNVAESVVAPHVIDGPAGLLNIGNGTTSIVTIDASQSNKTVGIDAGVDVGKTFTFIRMDNSGNPVNVMVDESENMAGPGTSPPFGIQLSGQWTSKKIIKASATQWVCVNVSPTS